MGKHVEEEGRGRAEVRTVREYIDENFLGTEPSWEELSYIGGLSPMYLRDAFKKETGMTLHQYILQRKMAVASALLSDSIMQVQEIAKYVDIEPTSYFSKCFRDCYGISPYAFRKKCQKVI